MPTYAPLYNPNKHQQSFLVRQQKAQARKRKRGQADLDDSDDDDNVATHIGSSPEPEPIPRTATSAFHPVNRTDPYYIAGHPREHPLPPVPFPHAAPKESKRPKPSIEQALAVLKPPLYIAPEQVEDPSTSLKRRHLDNLTTILHQSMLKGDWKRAHRAWSLLIRTEVSGRGVDVRRHGRWAIGAEILMRQGGRQTPGQSSQDDALTEKQLMFTDKGFDLARSYYERLILQYPQTQHKLHTLNATAIYPALFSIWIYSVQDRSKRARQALETQCPSSVDSTSSVRSEQRGLLKQIRAEELQDAQAVAVRMDDLRSSPPYDTDTTLLHLRGMLALWLADLHEDLRRHDLNDTSASELSDVSENIMLGTQHKPQARAERRKARELFSRLADHGLDLPASTQHFLRSEEG